MKAQEASAPATNLKPNTNIKAPTFGNSENLDWHISMENTAEFHTSTSKEP